MKQKDQSKLDKAVKSLLSMGEVPKHEPPTFTRKDLYRKFRMRVKHNGKGLMEEV